MGVSGFILLTLLLLIKPISMHAFFRVYIDLILFYGIMANLAYTATYGYAMLISNKLIEQAQTRERLKRFTYKTILVTGFVINLLAGVCELLYRISFM